MPPTTPYAAPVTHADTATSMEYCDLITDPTTKDTWLRSTANEFGRLAQGLPYKRVDPTNTIFFIPINKPPPPPPPPPTNDQPMQVSSAAIVHKKLNLTVHA